MTKPLLLGSCAILVGAMAILLAGIFYSPLTQSPVAECRRRISQIYRMLEIIADDHGKEIGTVIERGTNKDTHQLVLDALHDGAKSSSIGLPSYVSRTAIFDPWGRPFNVKWIDELPAGTNILRHPSTLCIWSSGENGVNEYGTNDDVFLLPSEL